jgi:hypothetical protein
VGEEILQLQRFTAVNGSAMCCRRRAVDRGTRQWPSFRSARRFRRAGPAVDNGEGRRRGCPHGPHEGEPAGRLARQERPFSGTQLAVPLADGIPRWANPVPSMLPVMRAGVSGGERRDPPIVGEQKVDPPGKGDTTTGRYPGSAWRTAKACTQVGRRRDRRTTVRTVRPTVAANGGSDARRGDFASKAFGECCWRDRSARSPLD